MAVNRRCLPQTSTMQINKTQATSHFLQPSILSSNQTYGTLHKSYHITPWTILQYTISTPAHSFRPSLSPLKTGVRPYVSLIIAFSPPSRYKHHSFLQDSVEHLEHHTENYYFLCELKLPAPHPSYVLHLSQTPRMFLLISMQIYQTLRYNNCA